MSEMREQLLTLAWLIALIIFLIYMISWFFS